MKICSHGFAFIPVHSAIDFDYYKTLNLSTDYNLLQHDVQDFLLANSPFHVISGFNYEDVGYPNATKPELNNMNWSHGYFTNTTIEDGTGDTYLCREIGDYKIYLNNIDLGERHTEFKFNEIFFGVQNPNYKYGYNLYNSKSINYVYSKTNNFKFKEPGIVKFFFDRKFEIGNYKNSDGVFIKSKSNIEPCDLSKNNRVSLIEMLFDSVHITPNPFEDYAYISNLSDESKYNLKIYNIQGEILLDEVIESVNNSQPLKINLTQLSSNALYIMSISNNNNNIVRYKLLKK